MKRRLIVGLVVPLLAACAPVARSPRAPGPRAAGTAVPARPPRVPETRAVLRLTSDHEKEGRVHGELRFEGELARAASLRFAPLHDVRLEAPSARDARGPIDLESVRDGEARGTRLALARTPVEWLDVRYTVVFATDEARPAPDAADGAGGSAEPIELRGAGEDLFVLPVVERDVPVAIELQLRTGGSSLGAASSFGLGLSQRTKARLEDVRRGFYLAGDVGTAAFHASDGDDLAGWLGHTAFDPRWVSAEIAGMRSVVDAWVGRSPSSDAPPLAYLFSATKRDETPILVVPRTRGLLVSADRRAVWNAPARILVTQAMTKRYVGSFLWIGDRRDPASGWFFSEGFSRTIAREALFDASLLDPMDRAAEMNALLTAVAFADDPERKSTATGAIVATALDVALQAKDKEAQRGQSLRLFIRELLTKAASTNRSELAREELVQMIRERTGDATARSLAAALDKNDANDVALPADLMGRCFRLTKKHLVLFELGFTTSAGEEMVVTSVKPGSRAAAADVRVGDVALDLRYEAGNSHVPVKLVVKRADKGTERKVELHYSPTGPSKPGRVFERVPGIPDERC